jgi:hypothetical protein
MPTRPLACAQEDVSSKEQNKKGEATKEKEEEREGEGEGGRFAELRTCGKSISK